MCIGSGKCVRVCACVCGVSQYLTESALLGLFWKILQCEALSLPEHYSIQQHTTWSATGSSESVRNLPISSFSLFFVKYLIGTLCHYRFCFSSGKQYFCSFKSILNSLDCS